MRLRRAKKAEADALETAPLGPNTIEPHVQAFRAGLGLPYDAAALAGLFPPGGAYSPQLIERVGVASRCLHLSAQQVANMPLRYRRAEGRDQDAPPPTWVANPDPAWFPNGIRDAVYAISASIYARGDSFLYVTSRYQDGYPATFTVLDPAQVGVGAEGGVRVFEVGGQPVNADDVLQITRNPNGNVRGTGSLQAYAGNLTSAWQQDLYAADIMASGGVPHAVLQPARRLSADQAAELQAQWVQRTSARGAAPPVVPPDVAFTQFSWSPADLMLLESRQYDSAAICGAFGVPPPLVGVPIPQGGLTYTNTTDLFVIWGRSELEPFAHGIDAALSLLWLPAGNWVEFDSSRLLAPPLSVKIDVAVKAIDAGVMTPDEARAWAFDLPPLTRGEALEEIDVPAGASPAATEPALVAVPRDEGVSA